MSLSEKLKMTDAEKTAWQEKLDALKLFTNTFSKGGERTICFDSSFFMSLSIKELLSKEYEEEMAKNILKLEPQRDVPFSAIISRKIRGEDSSTPAFFKDLTESEWHEFYDMVIEPKIDYSTCSYSSRTYGLQKVRRNEFFSYASNLRKDYEDFIYCIGNYGDFVEKEYLSDSCVDNIITKAFLDKGTKDLTKLATFVNKKFKNFHNYSPILFNESLDSASRGKLLKSFYRQKDLPQYKEFLRENRSRLDIFDTFVDVTITNNNRVTEKEMNFINLLISIYVTTSGYNYSRLDPDTSVGLVDFTKKYKDYFLNAQFISRLYSYGVGSMQKEVWSRREEFNKFMKTIFSAYSVDEILDSLFKDGVVSNENFAGATEPIAESLKEKFTSDNTELNKKLVKFFLARTNFDLVYSKILSLELNIEDYVDVIAPFADSYFKASSKRIGSRKSEDDIKNKVALGLFGYKNSLKGLSSLHFRTDKANRLLGFVAEDVKNAEYNNTYLKRLYNIHDALLGAYEKIIVNDSFDQDVAKSFYKVYLERYSNDMPFEESISEIPALAADSKTKDLEYSYWSSSPAMATSDAYVSLIRRIKTIAEIALPILKDEIPEETQTTILETLSNIDTNVSLLCAI